MDELIKHIRAYREAGELADRSQSADAIFDVVEPEMSRFVSGAIRPQLVEDVLQETLKAIVTSLPKFSGATGEDFLCWCRGVARHKIHDQYHDSKNERFQALPPEELLELMDSTAGDSPLATGERLDLDYAMKLLAESKPECCEYLWKRFGWLFELGEIAEELKVDYDTARMRVKRCLETVRELVA